MRKFVIGCDNAAVELKEILEDFLLKNGAEVEDVGCSDSKDPTNYPTIAERACRIIADSGFEKRGVLVCGTGVGMCIAANKCKGIRAAVGHDSFSAQRSILSNNGNVLCFGARVIGPELAKTILGEWISLEYVDGPSTPKVQEILAMEARYMC